MEFIQFGVVLVKLEDHWLKQAELLAWEDAVLRLR